MPAANPLDPQQVAEAKYEERKTRPGVTTKRTICATCDIACSVVTEVKNGRVVRVRSSDNPLFRDNICMKGIVAPKGFAHPNRITQPMKRVGERGPEAWSVSTSQWNTATDHGLGRRIMNQATAGHPCTPGFDRLRPAAPSLS